MRRRTLLLRFRRLCVIKRFFFLFAFLTGGVIAWRKCEFCRCLVVVVVVVVENHHRSHHHIIIIISSSSSSSSSVCCCEEEEIYDDDDDNEKIKISLSSSSQLSLSGFDERMQKVDGGMRWPFETLFRRRRLNARGASVESGFGSERGVGKRNEETKTMKMFNFTFALSSLASREMLMAELNIAQNEDEVTRVLNLAKRLADAGASSSATPRGRWGRRRCKRTFRRERWKNH